MPIDAVVPCYMHARVYTWERIKNIGFATGLGCHLATKRFVRDGRVLRQTHRDKPLEDYSTPQRSATRVCNRGPATKVCNRGGGPSTTRGFDPHPHVYIYNTHLFCMRVYVCMKVIQVPGKRHAHMFGVGHQHMKLYMQIQGTCNWLLN